MADRWPHWPTSCTTPIYRRCTPRSVRGTSLPSMWCNDCWSSSAASTRPRRIWPKPRRRRRPPALRAAPMPGGTVPGRPRSDDVGVSVPGAAGVLTKLAKCCTPVPGDEILGFVTRGGGVSVHRTDCTNATSLQQQAERIIEVHWAPSPSSVFLVAIQVEALDRHRLLSDVTRVLADERVNILSASVTTSGDRVAVSRFTFEMGDPKHLGHLLDVVRNVEGVFDVYRVTSAA